MSKSSQALLAALALTSTLLPNHAAREDRTYWQRPINTGRRAEKDAAALAKAQAKRDRKAAKRRGEA